MTPARRRIKRLSESARRRAADAPKWRPWLHVVIQRTRDDARHIAPDDVQKWHNTTAPPCRHALNIASRAWHD